VRTVTLPSPGSTRGTEAVTYVVCDELPTLVWLANLAVLEMHVPQWRVDDARARNPDRLVLDLDPGAPANVIECCQVALILAETLAADGLLAYPKTSGSKGMQMYVALDGNADVDTVHGFARRLAERLEKEHPRLVVSRMEKRLRPGKVLVDWSQNNAAKTTVAPYSMRGREQPTVSTPVTWDEVEQAARSNAKSRLPLRFDYRDALGRVDDDGDLMAPLLDEAHPLPGG
jgi:bifunctional non-homologous end joining protein LigD